MSETLISPGVAQNENDTSFINKQPVQVGMAIIGPTVKGPVEIPTIITSFSEFTNKFGTTLISGSVNNSDTYTYFTSIAAYNYFINGGKSIVVARVASGSFTSATSSINNSLSSASFVIETLSQGIIMNSFCPEVSGSLLASGSSDNIRWQVANADTSSGTFTLLVRRGDDNPINTTVLETWTGLSLDPKSSNFITRVIGDQKENYSSINNQLQITGSYRNASNYIRVKSVNFTTPNYLDNNGNPKSQYTASIPINASGSFGGAVGSVKGGANFYENINSSNTQGLIGSDYDNMINLLSNKDDYKFNVLITPGLYDTDYTSQITSLITNTQNRGDNIFVPDLVKYASTISTVVGQAQGRNTSYAAAYWPWCQVIDPHTGNNVWVPASTVIAGVYAYNDSVSEPWFAPAGINRGGLSQVIRAEQKLSQGNRDTLYLGKVNPIATFPGTGVVVFGQKTLQTRAGALDRINVRRLLIALKSYIGQVANNMVFDNNTATLQNYFKSQINPYLTSVQQKQGLYAFAIKMDDSNNTGDTIDRNQIIGDIYLQPTKTGEFVYLNYNITPTGVTFS